MTVEVWAAVSAALAAWLATASAIPPLRRLVGPAATTAGVGARAPLIEDPLRRTAVCVAAGGVLGSTLGGAGLAVAGAIGGSALSWWVGRLEPPRIARERRAVERDLPLAVDLLAACAGVGLPLDAGLRHVAAAVGGPLGARFDGVTARLQLGGDPLTEWARLRADPQLASLGRTLSRTVESGAPVVESLVRLAGDRRREQRTRQQLRARSVGVKAAGPLAICFLPAFLIVGVVPTVVSAFSTLVL